MAERPAEHDFSTLEVDHERWVEHDPHASPIVHQTDEKIVNHDKAFPSPPTGDSKEKILGGPEKAALVGLNGQPSDEKVLSHDDVDKENVPAGAGAATPHRKILGLRRRTFAILAAVVIIIILAIIGGAVGGTLGARRNSSSSTPPPAPATATAPPYANIGLAALQYTDFNGTMHRRVYYQDSSHKVRESAWDNSSAFDAKWDIHVISNATKPGTPIAAAAGWPHAEYNYTLVKNVYYMSENDEIFERQAPSNDSQAWENDNFSGLYSGSNATFLQAYWNQNITNTSQELVVLFQENDFENGITQGRYTSNSTSSNPWVANRFGFSLSKGSNFALSPASWRDSRHLTLYATDGTGKLGQHDYYLSDTDFDPKTVVSVISEQDTGFSVDPMAPLAVLGQDNQKFYTFAKLPECTRDRPVTHMIVYAAHDRRSLTLGTWNCTDGFNDHTPDIAPLQRPNATYLGLAGTGNITASPGDQTLYVMYQFDNATAPLVEEWPIPNNASVPWGGGRNVTVDFGL